MRGPSALQHEEQNKNETIHCDRQRRRCAALPLCTERDPRSSHESAGVAENGFASLEPHEALECLLYITNARKNTNRMAHELIDRFGDFAGVLDASEEELMTVEGVGPATARMLHLMPDVCRYYTQCRTGRNGCLKTTEQLAEHLMGLFAGAAQERALLLLELIGFHCTSLPFRNWLSWISR